MRASFTSAPDSTKRAFSPNSDPPSENIQSRMDDSNDDKKLPTPHFFCHAPNSPSNEHPHESDFIQDLNEFSPTASYTISPHQSIDSFFETPVEAPPTPPLSPLPPTEIHRMCIITPETQDNLVLLLPKGLQMFCPVPNCNRTVVVRKFSYSVSCGHFIICHSCHEDHLVLIQNRRCSCFKDLYIQKLSEINCIHVECCDGCGTKKVNGLHRRFCSLRKRI